MTNAVAIVRCRDAGEDPKAEQCRVNKELGGCAPGEDGGASTGCWEEVEKEWGCEKGLWVYVSLGIALILRSQGEHLHKQH